MATNSSQLRRGLPRTPGGEPWPPEGALPGDDEAATPAAPPAAESVAEPVGIAPGPEDDHRDTNPAPEAVPTAEEMSRVGAIRRGLPRTAGGEPWPPHGREATADENAETQTTPTAAASVESAQEPATEPETAEPAAQPATAEPVMSEPGAPEEREAPADDKPSMAEPASAEDVPAGATSGMALRRGLPRVPGGEPWPAAGLAPMSTRQAAPAPQATEPSPEPTEPASPSTEPAPEPTEPTRQGSVVSPEAQNDVETAEVAAAVGQPVQEQAAEVTDNAEPPSQGRAASTVPVEPERDAKPAPAKPVSEPVKPECKPTPAKPEPTKPARGPVMIGGRSLARWIVLGVLALIGATAVAGILVLAARGVTTLPGGREFLERYPGEYELPAVADTGFAAWARWTHFLNFFLIVLIIRSGLLVRQQQKPPAFWTPKKGGKKVSIFLWLHTSLDVLWLVNGLVFVVLLFATGHWARIVPTSWEVFPNAASALLQYMMLDWPTENGWVNYNSLQQLMYFIVVFIAAPLAAITGARLSEWWPKNTERLNRIYPAPLARAIHFPTMLFFVAFILVHVFLVLATGALRNLNHMFAGSDAMNWVGFWWFVAAIVVTAGAVVAARPLVLAPIANQFGRVSQR